MNIFTKIVFTTCILLHGLGSLQAQLFVDRSQEMGIDHNMKARVLVGGGAAFFDYDNDGDEDLYLSRGLDKDELYKNNGDGSFSLVLEQIGLFRTQFFNTLGVSTGDIDNDGDRDLFITTWEEQNFELTEGQHLLYENNGDGTFTDISWQAGITHKTNAHSATFVDYNKDGYLDIYVASHIEEATFTRDSTGTIIGYDHTCYPNLLYHNNGDNTFTEIAQSMDMAKGGCALAVVATDYDFDDDLDLYVANDFGGYVQPNHFFENQYPNDAFSEIGTANGSDVGIFGMGIAAGDYDRDLDVDFYITNIGRNVLLNNTEGQFVDTTNFAGVGNEYADSYFTTGWGTAFMDVDNDGWPDLFVSNGRIPGAAFNPTSMNDPHKLYLNNQDGTFTDITEEAGVGSLTYGRGMAYTDVDNDGDLDFVVVALDELGGKTQFYINEIENDNHYIQFELEGVVTNRDGYGSKVWVHADGQTFFQELYAGGNVYCSQNSSRLHFGLGVIDQVDSVRIEWLNGHVQVLQHPAVDQLHQVVEDVAVVSTKNINAVSELHIFPNPFSDGQLFIHFNDDKNEQPAHLQLLDVNGQLIAEQHSTLSNAPTPLDFRVKHLPFGLYFLRVTTDQFQHTEKILHH